jgi:hypothetical protein
MHKIILNDADGTVEARWSLQGRGAQLGSLEMR